MPTNFGAATPGQTNSAAGRQAGLARAKPAAGGHGVRPAAVGGRALGFDRLVMLAAGARSIAEVIAFPFDRA